MSVLAPAPLSRYRVPSVEREGIGMIKIRSAQVEALGQVTEAEFASRLAGLLRECFPDAREMPDAGLAEGVAQQIARARSHGLASEDGIAVYVVTAWQLGQDFDRAFPAAALVLDSPDYSPEQKRDWLETWALALFRELEGEG